MSTLRLTLLIEWFFSPPLPNGAIATLHISHCHCTLHMYKNPLHKAALFLPLASSASLLPISVAACNIWMVGDVAVLIRCDDVCGTGGRQKKMAKNSNTSRFWSGVTWPANYSARSGQSSTSYLSGFSATTNYHSFKTALQSQIDYFSHGNMHFAPLGLFQKKLYCAGVSDWGQ